MFLRIAPCAVLAAALAGCGPAKLDVTKPVSLDVGEFKSVDLDPQSKAQTITVEYDSPVEVSVYVYKSADAGADLEKADPTKAIKGETGKKAGKVTADVPANTAARVVVSGAMKKADVKLHVTNH